MTWENAGKIRLAVIQPTPFCNIDCKYCYLPARSAVERMPPNTLEETCRFLMSNPERLGEKLAIAWHAGEPLTVPRTFYESAFSLLARLAPRSLKIENWFQTNGTLIDNEWCDFMHRWNVKIGVSLDGPRWIHDANRVTRSGCGTFDRVIRGIECLQAKGLDFDVFTVITDKALNCPQEMWAFYLGLKVKSILFNFEEIQGYSDYLLVASRATARRCVFGPFSRPYWISATARHRQIYIREPRSFHRSSMSLTGDVETRWTESVPLAIVSIAWNGRCLHLFPPELLGIKRYSLRRDFVFGNALQNLHTMNGILTDSKFQSVYADIVSGIGRCKRSCFHTIACAAEALRPQSCLRMAPSIRAKL